jgi:hypothetical protein
MNIFHIFFSLSVIIFILALDLLIYNINAVLDKDLIFSEYHNTKYDFSIKYPSSWNLTELHSKSIENLLNVEIKSHFEGPRDMLQEKFVISINKLPENIDLKKYVDNALMQFNQTYLEFKLISDNSINEENIQSRTISYSYLAGIPPLSTKLVMTTEIISYNDKIYVLSFGTPPDKYYDFLSVMKEIFDSFEILKRIQII